jgi:cadmium resistance protein CadD (predicted permease)
LPERYPRWGHILLSVVLISIGLIILINGHAFSLFSTAHAGDQQHLASPPGAE